MPRLMVPFFCLILLASVAGKETSHEDALSSLQADVKSMKQRYDYQIKKLVVKNTELKTRIAFLEGKGPAMPFESPIAFTAGLSETFSGGDWYEVVPFNVSILNHGGHFSFEEHRFVAPVRGFYWFTLSIRVPNGYFATVIMRVNGEEIAATRAYDINGDAVTTILLLEAGDWTDCVKEEPNHELAESSYPRRSNIFAGFLYAQL